MWGMSLPKKGASSPSPGPCSKTAGNCGPCSLTLDPCSPGHNGDTGSNPCLLHPCVSRPGSWGRRGYAEAGEGDLGQTKLLPVGAPCQYDGAWHRPSLPSRATAQDSHRVKPFCGPFEPSFVSVCVCAHACACMGEGGWGSVLGLSSARAAELALQGCAMTCSFQKAPGTS